MRWSLLVFFLWSLTEFPKQESPAMPHFDEGIGPLQRGRHDCTLLGVGFLTATAFLLRTGLRIGLATGLAVRLD